MFTVSPLVSAPEAVMAELRGIGDRLRAASPADTVACAYGIGRDVLVWYDESDGQYFDLASLTKPLFTAPTVLKLLADHGALDEPVERVLSWLPGGSTAPTARDLLTHASGLPAELPADGDESQVRVWVAEAVREAKSGTVTYSDVNYWLLGQIVSAMTRTPLAELFAEMSAASDGSFVFGHAPADRSVHAGPVVDGRRLVHDGAARRLGLCGHAGAFGTLRGVVQAVMSWLERDWLSEPLSGATVTCQTHAMPGGHRSLAWTLAGDPFHAVAHDWPPTTLCHTGFTGVSVALDPASQWWAVYLSNAIPIARDAGPILQARRLYHAHAAAHLNATGNEPVATNP